MGLVIESGTGSGNMAGVNPNNRLLVQSVTEKEIEDHSTRGFSFAWNSSYLTTGINENVMSLKSLDTVRHIHVTRIVVGSDVAQTWTLSEVLTGTTVGTVIQGKNLNLLSGLTANTSGFGNAPVTGVLTMETIILGASMALNQSTINLESALLVQLNNEIVVTASAVGTVFVSVFGYFEVNHI